MKTIEIPDAAYRELLNLTTHIHGDTDEERVRHAIVDLTDRAAASVEDKMPGDIIKGDPMQLHPLHENWRFR